MVIRKQFKFEAAHRVRTSTGSRCKNSIHGHSYIVELFLNQKEFDPDASMVMDFGDLKHDVAEFFDCLDHATFVWDKDDPDYFGAIMKYSRRVIVMEQDPTAENMAKAFFRSCVKLIQDVSVEVHSVRVHETATGYAQAFDFSDNDTLTVMHPNDD